VDCKNPERGRKKGELKNSLFFVYLCDVTTHAKAMPTLFIFFGMRFMFFSNDHEPIHIHVIKGKGKIKEFAVFQVDPEIVLIENNGLKTTELKIAEMVIEERRALIVKSWNLFFGDKTERP
jgi:hypothetical protein